MTTGRDTWGSDWRAAVSLTYDDGIPNQLDVAIPMLESYGFRGTFYLSTSPDCRLMHERAVDWRAAFNRGHEIGNHSVHHPGWRIGGEPPPAYRLEDFSPDDIRREVGEAAAWLDQHIGTDPDRTYAYPYAQDFIGPDRRCEPYHAAVRAFCAGSRLGGGSVPNVSDTDPFRLRGFSFGANTPPDQLIGYCEQTLSCGGWAILDFHGVGGPWIETPAETHRTLLEFLARHPIRVAPVRDILRERSTP